MAEEFGRTGSARPEHGKQGSIQIVYPKFDLGKVSRQLDRPLLKVYATIDSDGEQRARLIGHRTDITGNHKSHVLMPLARWLDWRRR